jgi:triacylglycerol lipase
VDGCATGEDAGSISKEAMPTTGAGEQGAEGTSAEGTSDAKSAGYTQTRYPIVLAHGMSGWKELFGVVDYFFGIPSELRAGGAQVFVTAVSAFASTEARGEQLLQQVEYIVASTGAQKVNLIGHSQGGLDGRYVAAVRPDLVASLTTVGTPHEGAGVADWLLENTAEGGFTQTVIDVLGSALGLAIDLLAGTDNPQDAIAALRQVSTEGLDAFNGRYPQGLPGSYCGSGPESQNGIRFYSWTGHSVLTNLLDPTDAPFGITSFFGDDSDGLVDRCAAHFGRVIRDTYRMNHLDEVNQILGLVSLFESSPKSVFRAHANRLKNAGL